MYHICNMHHHRNLYVSFSHPVFRLLCGTHLQNTADAYTAMYSLCSYDFHKYGTRTNPLHLLLLRQYQFLCKIIFRILTVHLYIKWKFHL